MAQFIETTIAGYSISLDPDMDGARPGEQRVSGCWIELRKNGNSYIGSLALLQDLGHLECDKTSDTVEVPEAVIEKIAEWADANGY